MTAPCPILSFLVEGEVEATLTERQRDELWKAFETFVVDRGLIPDGGTGRTRWSFMLHGEAAQATDGDRDAVEGWLARRREVTTFRVGPIIDLQDLVGGRP